MQLFISLTGKFENCAPEIRRRFAKFTSKYIRASKLRARYLGCAIQTFQTGLSVRQLQAMVRAHVHIHVAMQNVLLLTNPTTSVNIK